MHHRVTMSRGAPGGGAVLECADAARETVLSVCVDVARKRLVDGRGEGECVLACVMDGDVAGMEPPDEFRP